MAYPGDSQYTSRRLRDVPNPDGSWTYEEKRVPSPTRNSPNLDTGKYNTLDKHKDLRDINPIYGKSRGTSSSFDRFVNFPPKPPTPLYYDPSSYKSSDHNPSVDPWPALPSSKGQSKQSAWSPANSIKQSMTTEIPSIKHGGTVSTEQYVLPCGFAFLGCQLSFGPKRRDDWTSHTVSHLHEVPKLSERKCHSCPALFSSQIHAKNEWSDRLDHCWKHFQEAKRPPSLGALIDLFKFGGLLGCAEHIKVYRYGQLNPLAAGYVFKTQVTLIDGEMHEKPEPNYDTPKSTPRASFKQGGSLNKEAKPTSFRPTVLSKFKQKHEDIDSVPTTTQEKARVKRESWSATEAKSALLRSNARRANREHQESVSPTTQELARKFSTVSLTDIGSQYTSDLRSKGGSMSLGGTTLISAGMSDAGSSSTIRLDDPFSNINSIRYSESDKTIYGDYQPSDSKLKFEHPRLSKANINLLEAKFTENPKPAPHTKRLIAKSMDVPLDRINNWYQNRRSKRKQEQKQEQYEKVNDKAAVVYSEPFMPTLLEVDMQSDTHSKEDNRKVDAMELPPLSVASTRRSMDSGSLEDETDWDAISSMGSGMEGMSLHGSEERDDTVTLGRQLTSAQLRLVDRLMEEFWAIFNDHWQSGIRQCGQEHPGTTNRSLNASSSTPASANNWNTSSKPKRLRSNDEGDSDNDKERPSKRKGKEPATSGSPEDPSLRFACPYRKRDPRKYCIAVQKWRRCALTSHTTVARVKAHLYQYHSIYQCPRCKKLFPSEDVLDAHIVDKDGCDPRTTEPVDGITSKIKAKLQCRKKAHPRETEAERWQQIYKILFQPSQDEAIPSPYFETVHDTTDPTSPPPTQHDFASYEAYLRLEVPRTVLSVLHRAVSTETDPILARLREQLPDLIQEAQNQAFANWRTLQTSDPPAPVTEGRRGGESSEHGNSVDRSDRGGVEGIGEMRDRREREGYRFAMPMMASLPSPTSNDSEPTSDSMIGSATGTTPSVASHTSATVGISVPAFDPGYFTNTVANTNTNICTTRNTTQDRTRTQTRPRKPARKSPPAPSSNSTDPVLVDRPHPTPSSSTNQYQYQNPFSSNDQSIRNAYPNLGQTFPNTNIETSRPVHESTTYDPNFDFDADTRLDMDANATAFDVNNDPFADDTAFNTNTGPVLGANFDFTTTNDLDPNIDFDDTVDPNFGVGVASGSGSGSGGRGGGSGDDGNGGGNPQEDDFVDVALTGLDWAVDFEGIEQSFEVEGKMPGRWMP